MEQIFLVVAVLIVCISVSGCISGPAQPIPAATQYTPPATPGSPAMTSSATPGPVQTVPEYESVSVTVNRNVVSTDPTITVVYNGGKGLGMTTLMNATVIRSDGGVETDFRVNPKMGTSITLMGTTESDRVIVTVTMTSGDTYTVIDKYYPFPGSMVPSTKQQY